MVENSVSSSENTDKNFFTISLDWTQVPLTNVVYSNIDFKKDTKIEIVHTRSYCDFLRGFLFFMLRIIFLIVIFCLYIPYFSSYQITSFF